MSVTGRSLRRRMWALIGLTGVVLASFGLVLGRHHAVTQELNDEAVTAVTEVAEARLALVKADRMAIGTLTGPAVRLTGPGEEYLGNITLASQSLEQVAEVNAAGTAGSQTLQVLSSMITTYNGLVERAIAAAAGGDERLGLAQVWYASDFLHGSILGQLDTLDRQQARALATADRSFWTSGRAPLLWAGPAAVLLVLLLETQVFLYLRFRRLANLGLAPATVVVLLALVAAPSVTLTVDRSISRAAAGLEQVRSISRGQAAGEAVAGQRQLRDLVEKQCEECRFTLAGLKAAGEAGYSSSAGPPSAQEPARLLASAETRSGHWLTRLAVGLLAALILIPAGLAPRIREYGERT